MSDTYSEELGDVLMIYEGSDGDATKALYDRLAKLGPIGAIALNLFRAHKNSTRAKVYRGGGYRGMAYDRKQWAMGNLATILSQHAQACGIRWGWGIDPQQAKHNVVLYVDIPTGQVSFHTEARGAGPDYPGAWDGIRNQTTGRVCGWCARLLSGQNAPATQSAASASS